MASNWERVVVTIVSVLLALLFLGIGLPKLVGVEMQVESFKNWGYPPWFVHAIGATEVVAALLLLMRGTRLFGAALLACVMAGAALTHGWYSEFDRLGPPIVLLVLSALIAGHARSAGRGGRATDQELGLPPLVCARDRSHRSRSRALAFDAWNAPFRRSPTGLCHGGGGPYPRVVLRV